MFILNEVLPPPFPPPPVILPAMGRFVQ
uniref:Uncharacterized protein n=1 Tax=Nymphaea colorata TaxID=210225 RepID=A0A5K0VJ98_9MAGN